MLTVISLGAGVQSTTMALMAAHGEITPMPDCAIFADTQWEPKRVYKHLDWLEKLLPFPVHRVTAGNLRTDLFSRNSKRAGRFASIPAFFLSPNGEIGMGRRQCTSHYKIEPIQKKVRELLGYQKGQRIPEKSARMLIGISVDEAIRMKPSQNKWMVNTWPLIEKDMTRRACLVWIHRHNYPTPVKSSCIGCPYHSDDYWRKLKEFSPAEWQDAVELDAKIRDWTWAYEGTQFLHRQCVPLPDVDLSTPRDWGQDDLFGNECEGMCGV